jgi:hypothetical protein
VPPVIRTVLFSNFITFKIIVMQSSAADSR